jgi:RNA polymerase sigma factor (sigma-70 family)
MDKDAIFVELQERIRKIVRGVRHAVYRPRYTEATDDFVQRVYLRLKADKRSLQDALHAERVVRQLARNVIIDHIRRRRSAKQGGGSQPVEIADDIGISDEVYDSSTARVIDGLLADFAKENPEAHEAVWSRYVFGLTIRETAETMGISDMTVRRYTSLFIQTARRELGIAEQGPDE